MILEKMHLLAAEALPKPYNSLPWQTRGLQDHLRRILVQDEDADALERIVPDAFAVVPETKTLTLLEIVATNDVNDNKARRLVSLFWFLDEYCWNLEVLVFYPKYAMCMIVDEEALCLMDSLAERISDGESDDSAHKTAFNLSKRPLAAQKTEAR